MILLPSFMVSWNAKILVVSKEKWILRFLEISRRRVFERCRRRNSDDYTNSYKRETSWPKESEASHRNAGRSKNRNNSEYYAGLFKAAKYQ